MPMNGSQASWMKMAVTFALLALVSLLWANQAFAAGTTGAEFQGLYEMVRDWSTGYLGKTIAIAFLLVGLGLGIIRGSIMAAVSSIAAGVALIMLPVIVDAMFATT